MQANSRTKHDPENLNLSMLVCREPDRAQAIPVAPRIAGLGLIGPEMQVILNADDFGRSAAINAAVMQSHREGVLTSASLMVAGDAVEEAVALARETPTLAIGLHVVVVAGRAVLPPNEIPHLVDGRGWFPRDPVRTGLRYFLRDRARRYYHIYEFSHDEDCLFRLAIGKSDRDLTLSDGTPVCRGERVGELHLWNERIPPVPTTGPDLAWGRTIQRRMRRSLGELAAYVESAPQFQGIQAFRGEMAFESRDGRVQMAHVVEHWGFHLADRDLGGGPWQRFTEFWENIYTLVLIWVFNRGSLKGKSPRNLKRYRFWISREALIRRYRKERPSDLTESHVEREGAPATVDLHSHRGQAAPQES